MAARSRPRSIAEESSANGRSLISPPATFCDLRRALRHVMTEVMSAHRALESPFGYSFATVRALTGVVAGRLRFEQPHRVRLTFGRVWSTERVARAYCRPWNPAPNFERCSPHQRRRAPLHPARAVLLGSTPRRVARGGVASCGSTFVSWCLRQAARRRGRHDHHRPASRRDELCGHAPGESAAQRHPSARADHDGKRSGETVGCTTPASLS